MQVLTPKVKAVYDYLAMATMRLPVGMLLPSVAEIRDKFSVSQLTVQRAFDTLEAMGKIRRVPGKGVFVDNPIDTGEIAIVITPRLLQPESSLYYSRTVAALAAEISSQTKGLQIRLHLGKDMDIREYTTEKYVTSLGLDDSDIMLRLRGVISFHSIGALHDKLISNGIPVCFLGGNDGHPSSFVTWNRESFFRRSLKYAAAQGLKDVCFFGFSGWGSEPERDVSEFEHLMCEYGFAPHHEWGIFIKERMSERVGYEMFHRLWQSPTKPQLIIAIDDTACSGMLEAVKEMNLDIPGDFQLITYANKGMVFPYNRKITRYEADYSVQAGKAVETLLNQLKNGTVGQPEQVLLEPVFIEGETTF